MSNKILPIIHDLICLYDDEFERSLTKRLEYETNTSLRKKLLSSLYVQFDIDLDKELNVELE